MSMKEEKSKNLIESIHAEMDRCRELKKLYDAIPMGFISASMIAGEIKFAEIAIEENDVVKMLLAYKKLQEIEG